jgi:lysophospholipase L1-like esterase
MNDDLKKWDFRSWVPDIVVIYLGSNDFSTRPNPDKEVFISEYLKLLNKVRGYYSGARIFCIEGQQQEPFSEYLKIILNKFGDKKTSTILFSPVDKLQLGCDWHPNADAQKKMAEELLAGMIKAGI